MVLNICYERDNVVRLVSAGGVPPLIAFAKDDSHEDLQANAAGAVQSICFQKEGRTFVRELGAIEAVLPLLASANLKVQTRAVGAVHNMSSEPEAIRVIRRLGGLTLHPNRNPNPNPNPDPSPNPNPDSSPNPNPNQVGRRAMEPAWLDKQKVHAAAVAHLVRESTEAPRPELW